jgi:hypothetical protein
VAAWHSEAALAALACALVFSAPAADLTGKWQAEFDTQIGRQKYLFDLKVEGEKITGKASSTECRRRFRSKRSWLPRI